MQVVSSRKQEKMYGPQNHYSNDDQNFSQEIGTHLSAPQGNAIAAELL
jgi:hypothetical protein